VPHTVFSSPRKIPKDERYSSDPRFRSAYGGGNGKGITMTPQRRDWEHLAKAASEEMDPKKLMILVDELNRVLDQNDKLLQRPVM
jgi:hypothetical protein